MKMLAEILRELAGLFVDDGALALAIIGIVAAAAAISFFAPGLLYVPGLVLLFGCLGVIFLNTLLAASR